MDDATVFREWLSVRACASSAWLPSDGYLAHNGLGAIMVATRLTFAHALEHNASIAFPRTWYTNPRVCKGRTLGCYFARPCRTIAPLAHRKRVSVKWSEPPHIEFFWREAGLSRPRSVRWINAQLARYLFEPLPHVRASIERLRVPIGCLAVHLRGTDKISEDSRVRTLSLGAIVKATRSASRFESAGTVCLSSDSDVTLERAKAMLSPLSVWTPPNDWFISTANTVNERNRLLTRESRNGTRDEGLSLISLMFGLASCDAFLALASSNLAIIVQDLSDGQFVDFSGRPYCGLGGSFCA